MQNDLFAEPQRIIIKDNPLLQRVANEILDIAEHHPELLDSDNPGVIDRRLAVSLWLPELRQIVPDPTMRGELTKFLCDPQRCTSVDIVSRARRYCVEHDHMRLSKKAIESGIENKQRVEQSLRK